MQVFILSYEGVLCAHRLLTGVCVCVCVSSSYLNPPKPTFCRVPIKFILGFIIRTYKKVGFGRSR